MHLTWAGASNQFPEVAICDGLGRLVQTLPVACMNGRARLNWDGYNQTGRPVPTGLYFVRASAEGQTATQELILVR